MEIYVVILLLVNIAAVAFSYGKLTQKVNDVGRRLDEMGKRLNDVEHALDGLTKRGK